MIACGMDAVDRESIQRIKKDIVSHSDWLTFPGISFMTKLSSHIGITKDQAEENGRGDKFFFSSSEPVAEVIRQVFPADTSSRQYDRLAKLCYTHDFDETFEEEVVLDHAFGAIQDKKSAKWLMTKAAKVVMRPLPWGVKSKSGLPFRVVGVYPSVDNSEDYELYSETIFFGGEAKEVQIIHERA